jgi:hypothetical protein
VPLPQHLPFLSSPCPVHPSASIHPSTPPLPPSLARDACPPPSRSARRPPPSLAVSKRSSITFRDRPLRYVYLGMALIRSKNTFPSIALQPPCALGHPPRLLTLAVHLDRFVDSKLGTVRLRCACYMFILILEEYGSLLSSSGWFKRSEVRRSFPASKSVLNSDRHLYCPRAALYEIFICSFVPCTIANFLSTQLKSSNWSALCAILFLLDCPFGQPSTTLFVRVAQLAASLTCPPDQIRKLVGILRSDHQPLPSKPLDQPDTVTTRPTVPSL